MSQSSVVRVFATTQESDFCSPWQALSSENATGSGVVVGPNQILTGAHVVADATFLQVQKISAPDKTIAKVTAICHDSDLALLAVEDASFMADVAPATVGDLPAIQDHVSVVGFPVGGEEISITEGVVSRVEVQRYTHSQRELLAVTVDAAINDGNSGGPVFDEQGLIVGIAFQSLDEAENIGEMVPAPLIRHFLDAIENGYPLTIPALGIQAQNLENPVLRRSRGLQAHHSGVQVLRVLYGGSAWQVLEQGDVILEVDGLKVANNGTVRFHDRFRTSYLALLCEHFVGEKIPLKIHRAGEELDLTMTLEPFHPLVPDDQHDRMPTYFIYCGMVFQPLSLDYLKVWRKWWERGPTELVYEYYRGIRTEDHQSLVTLTQVLSDEVNVGYEELADRCVKKVNGKPPRNMADFVDRVESTDGLVELEMSSGELVVFDSNQATAARDRILSRYRVDHDRSPDLRTPC